MELIAIFTLSRPFEVTLQEIAQLTSEASPPLSPAPRAVVVTQGRREEGDLKHKGRKP